MKDVAAGARLVGNQQLGRLAMEPSQKLVDVALSGADGSDEGDVGAAILGGVGDGDGVLVDIETDIERGRVAHG